MKIHSILIALAGILVAVMHGRAVQAQDGAALFKPCAACHSIGGGRMVGPDLKGVTKRRSYDWLVKFIQSSGKVIKSGDPVAVALLAEYRNVPMPDNALTADQINLILTAINGGKAMAGAVDPKQAALQKKIDSLLITNSPQDIRAGQELFTGARRFINGGASCTSCHNVSYNGKGNGGLLAKDLTKAYSRLGGFEGIKGIIMMPPFPSMAVTYKNNPVLDEEAACIQLFLKSADGQYAEEPAANKSIFLRSGLLVGLLVTLSITFIWYKRKRKSVNHAILKRQERYSI